MSMANSNSELHRQICREKYAYVFVLTLIMCFCCFIDLAIGDYAENVKTSYPIFKDVTEQAGFGKLNHYLSYSAAAADYNQDGFIDLVISHHGSISLWKNNGDGTFQERSKLLKFNKGDTHGVSFIDINNDHFPDIVVACGAKKGHGEGKNLFFINDRKGGFVFLTEPPVEIADKKGRGRSITPDDYNNDGRIDLLIFNRYQPGRPHKIAVAKKTGISFETVEGGKILTIESSGIKVLNLHNNIDKFYIPTGFGRNSDIYLKDKTGFHGVAAPLGVQERPYISVAPFDMDNDGDFDLLYAHRSFGVLPKGAAAVNGDILFSYGKKNFHEGFRAEAGAGKITINILFDGKKNPSLLFLGKNKRNPATLPCDLDIDAVELAGKPAITVEGGNPGVYLWCDNNQLHFELIGGDVLKGVSGKISPKAFSFDSLMDVSPINYPHLLKNSLYENFRGKYRNISRLSGIGGRGLAMALVPADFNNDGFEDIYQVNAGFSFSETNPPNQLFINDGDHKFSEVAKQAGATGPSNGIGNGAIAFDYDNDGDLDLLLYNGYTRFPLEPGPITLLQNQGGKNTNSVSIKLQGTVSNSSGWGARIISRIGASRHYQQKYGMNGFLATSDLPIHIGMGEAEYIDKITVKWPSGITQSVYNVKSKSRLVITEARDVDNR